MVLGVLLSCSVGSGAMLDVNGEIDPSSGYGMVVMDTAGESFVANVDIEASHRDEDGGRYTVGTIVADLPISAIGVLSPEAPSEKLTERPHWESFSFLSSNDDPLELTRERFLRQPSSLTRDGDEVYSFEVTMYDGEVDGFVMRDTAEGAKVALALLADLKYAADTGPDSAIKTNRFTNLTPASPFDLALLFAGG